MKQFILAFYFLFISIVVFSQAPNAFNYQAVVRNSSGEIIANQSVSFKISILQGSATGIEAYSETHSVATNNFGLANLKIGAGESKSGTFSQIDWGVTSYFIKIEIDINGGNNFVYMGTSQLLSVPYAIYAKSAENTFSGNYNDLSNKPDSNQWIDVNNGIEYNKGIINVSDINLNDSTEIFFNENGQISSHDNNHRILFRRTENIFEIREWGDIVFSSGSTEGAETNTMNIQSDGKVGVGVEEPQEKLDVNGTIYSRTSGFKFPDGSVQTTAAVSNESGTVDNWGTQVVQSNNTLFGSGVTENKLGVDTSVIATKKDLSQITIIENQISDLNHFTGENIIGDETAFNGWDKNVVNDVTLTGNQTINGDKSFTNVIKAKGMALPYTFGPDTNYTGDSGAFIGFGHLLHSEDFIGYKNNRFYFKDSPGGGDTVDPDIIVGGKVGIGVEEPQEKLEVNGIIYSKTSGFKFPDGTIQTTASVSNGGGTADNWGTQVVQHNNTLSGFGTVSNPLEVNENTIQVDWGNIQNMPAGFADNVDNVNDNDADPTNEIQSISINGNEISLSKGGGAINLPEGAGASVWTKNDDIVYYNAGKVGIGISNPLSKLSVGAVGVSKAAIYGSTYATNGIGVYGNATANKINQFVINYGGYFEAAGNYGYGVYGEGNTGVCGKGFNSGISGLTENNIGAGVRGKASNTIGTNYGGHFTSDGKTGTGVLGIASSNEDAINYGGFFTAKGQHGIGVYGHAATKEEVYDSYGGYFISDAKLGIGVKGIASETGTYRNFGGVFQASGAYGVGIHADANLIGGEFTSTNKGNDGKGLLATCSAINGIAVSAEAKGMEAIAVKGWASHYSTGKTTYGGYFKADGTKGIGIFAKGKYLAGKFDGDVEVDGEVDADDMYADYIYSAVLVSLLKTFQIDHPLKPETHYLRHASIESNQVMNMYSGTVKLNENGEAWVEFPDWFTALNKKFTYQLTCIGGFANVFVAEELLDNRFKIGGGKTGMKVSWMVTGIRHDKYVEENPLQVEIEKSVN